MSFFDFEVDGFSGKLEEERVSGSGNFVNEAGVYTAVIKMAKGLESKNSDSKGIQLDMETQDGKKISWRTYFLNKDGKPYYIDKTTGEKKDLMGYQQLMALCVLMEGKMQFPKSEPKKIDGKDGAEEKADVMVDWLNKPIGICVKTVQEDKYDKPTETRTYAEVQHFFDPVDNRFASEKPEGEAKKIGKFREAIEAGKTNIDRRDKSKGGDSGGSNSAAKQQPKF
jgi:hypothetical protein